MIRFCVFIITMFISFSCVLDHMDSRFSIVNKTGISVYIFWTNSDNLKKVLKENSVEYIDRYNSMNALDKDSIETIGLFSNSTNYNWEYYFKENDCMYIYAFDSTNYDGYFEKTCINGIYFKRYKINLDTIKKYDSMSFS